jgi:RHS repeat-associated protein
MASVDFAVYYMLKWKTLLVVLISWTALFQGQSFASVFEGLFNSLAERNMVSLQSDHFAKNYLPERWSDGMRPSYPIPEGFYDEMAADFSARLYLVDRLVWCSSYVGREFYPDGYQPSAMDGLDSSQNLARGWKPLPYEAGVKARIEDVKGFVSRLKRTFISQAKYVQTSAMNGRGEAYSDKALPIDTALGKAIADAAKKTAVYTGFGGYSSISSGYSTQLGGGLASPAPPGFPWYYSAWYSKIDAEFSIDTHGVSGGLELYSRISSLNRKYSIPWGEGWQKVNSGDNSVRVPVDTKNFKTSDVWGWWGSGNILLFTGEFNDAWKDDDCGSCAQGDCDSASLGSVRIALSLGQERHGRLRSFLKFDADKPSQDICNSKNLVLRSGGDSYAVTDPSGKLRQVVSPSYVVTVLDGDASVALSFYSRASSGTANPDGTYAVSGTPLKTVTLNLGSSGGAVDETTLDMVTDDGRKSVLSRYRFDAAAQNWSLTTGDGARKETMTVSWNQNRTEKTEERRVYDAQGGLCSATRETFRNYSWGQELVLRIKDPGGANLVEQWDYYPEYGSPKLKFKSEASGYWEAFDYDGYGREVKRISQWKDSVMGSPEGNHRVAVTTYQAGSTQPYLTRIDSVRGSEVGRHYQALVGDETLEIDTVLPGALWNDPTNRVERIRWHHKGPMAGKIQSVVRPDGTAVFYDYAWDGDVLRSVTTEGAPNSNGSAIIDGLRTTRQTNRAGVVLEETVEDIGTGSVWSSKKWSDPDDRGNMRTLTHEDGSSELTQYGCCGALLRTDRMGGTESFEYDEFKRISLHNRAGVALQYRYDPDGRLIETTRVGSDSSPVLVSRTSYDLAGRQIRLDEPPVNGGSEPTQTLFSTSYDASGRRVSTTVFPGGASRVETFLQDGRILSVTGSAGPARRYEYGVEEISREGVALRCLFTKEVHLNAAGEDSGAWTAIYRDALDREIRRVETGGQGGRVTDFFYNAKGQLSKLVEPDGLVRLFAYNAKGEQEVSAIDADKNGQIDFGGVDRITKTSRAYALKNPGRLVERVTQEVWNTDGNASSTILGASEKTSNGRFSWETRHGVTRAISEEWLGSGRVKRLAADADGASTEEILQDGLLVSSTKTAAGGQVVSQRAFGYDAHRRRILEQDGRGGVTGTQYFPDDTAASVTRATADSSVPPQTTSYVYNVRRQKSAETLPDATTVNYSYDPRGLLVKTWGSRVYPVQYAYDSEGRLTSMTTWKDFTAGAGSATTTWSYDAATGWLAAKQYADGAGPRYTYDQVGRVTTRTSARGIVTTYGYNASGDLQSLSYSDGTPAVALERRRSGEVVSVVDASGTSALNLTPHGSMVSQTYASGPLAGIKISNQYDPLNRRTASSAETAVGRFQATYQYDGASRLSLVSNGRQRFVYEYAPAGGSLVTGIDMSDTAAGSASFRVSQAWDALGRLRSVSGSRTGAAIPLQGVDYAYNGANQRTSAGHADGSAWTYGYDALGQVIAGGRRWSQSGEAVLGQQFGYSYDDIGNRTAASVNGRASGYRSNALNQYLDRTVGGVIEVFGTAAPDVTVTLEGGDQPVPLPSGSPAPGAPGVVERQGNYFYGRKTVDNAAAPYSGRVTVTAVKNNAGANGEDAVARDVRAVALPKTPETFTHDADGNLTGDGLWSYAWDAENRLVGMETSPEAALAGVPRKKLSFGYDFQGRRVRKIAYEWESGGWSRKQDTRFAYEGWSLVAEIEEGGTIRKGFTWGVDLSGTQSGAGGVGGLLCVTDLSGGATEGGRAGGVFTDGRGNVTGLASFTDGALAAVYEYGPFGEPLRATGAMAEGNPFRFSTKYQDQEAELLYYGYRYYQQVTGGWLNRDPIGERGGLNLYRLAGNNPVDLIDALGLDVQITHRVFNISGGVGLGGSLSGELKVTAKDCCKNGARVVNGEKTLEASIKGGFGLGIGANFNVGGYGFGASFNLNFANIALSGVAQSPSCGEEPSHLRLSGSFAASPSNHTYSGTFGIISGDFAVIAQAGITITADITQHAVNYRGDLNGVVGIQGRYSLMWRPTVAYINETKGFSREVFNGTIRF